MPVAAHPKTGKPGSDPRVRPGGAGKRIMMRFESPTFQMPLLHRVTIALFTIFVVVWSYLAFYPDPVLNAHGLTPDAQAFVAQSLKDFCGGLYSDSKCPATQITGKQKWIATTFLGDRKSTRLNSSHLGISYAVFCLKKKK